ncbi:MAG TPA: hypothetical protein VG276_31735, partial [Actinomycetes bacterium]|nr:hypothetical protein [Actinomycetes bacterium]
AGQLGPDRLEVAGRSVAVGDRVVCGKNALARLEVANGTRGTVTAIDPQARTLTIQIGDNTDAKGRGAPEGATVTLPASYLDGRDRPGAPPRVDLAYATTGHKAQGLTKWTSLPFVTGREDAQWLFVVLSRARHLTRIYTVTGPEERPADLDHTPDNRAPVDGYERLSAAMGRDRSPTLASDARRLVDLRGMATGELRAERDRLDELLATAPRDRHHESARAAARHAEREQHLRELRAAGVGGRELVTATRRADRAGEDARQLRRHQQRRAGWLEAHADLVAERQAVGRELAWRRRADTRALELDPPADLVAVLGSLPEDRMARQAWRAAAGQVDGYRRAYGIDKSRQAEHEGRAEPAAALSERPVGGQPGVASPLPRNQGHHVKRDDRLAELLGPEPRGDLRQRRAWQAARSTVERLPARVRGRDDCEREAG